MSERPASPGGSAYPGTLTYLDLIRKNKAESALLTVAMVVLAGLVGSAAGAALGGWGGADQRALAVSAIVGGAAALAAGAVGAAWSWFGGDKAILRMSGALPVQKQDDPELFNVVDEVRIAAGLPMPRVYVIPSDSLNAFATGRDPAHASVAITTGLRRALSRDELQGVMAHEVAHVRHFDIRFAMLMATMVGLIVFASDAMMRSIRFGRMGRVGGGGRRSGKGDAGAVIVLVIALVLLLIAPLLAKLIQFAISRRREYLADAGAVELTRNPLGLAGALRKLADSRVPLETANRATVHLFIVDPTKKAALRGQNLNSVFSTHPPVEERIARLLALTR